MELERKIEVTRTETVRINTEIIIGHGHTKRRIKGPFQIAGDPAWLREIAHQLLSECGEGRGYGWRQIVIRMDTEPMTNNAPIEWD